MPQRFSKLFVKALKNYVGVWGFILALVIDVLERPLLAAFVFGAAVTAQLCRFAYVRYTRSLRAASRPIRTTEEEYLHGLDLGAIESIDILAHTGRHLFECLNGRLVHLASQHQPTPKIRLLLRDPAVEEKSRSDRIWSTVRDVVHLRGERVQVDVRFYEGLPSIRGAIARFGDGEVSSFASIYDYERNVDKSFAWDHALTAKPQSGITKPEQAMLESWFRHYWRTDEVHTIVFDFDDTLAHTGPLQVAAWTQAICEAFHRKQFTRSHCSEALSDVLDQAISHADVEPIVWKAFLTKQIAGDIINELLPRVDMETKARINERRFDIREKLMPNAELFKGVANCIRVLAKSYNLAIVSSTQEGLIREFLSQHGLAEHFPYVLGKRDPMLRKPWEHVYSKAILLIKLSELVGIPTSRMIFIGDNNSDYQAASQLGVDFIEARQAAISHGDDTLIDPMLPESDMRFFTSFEGEDLNRLVEEINADKEKRKYKDL